MGNSYRRRNAQYFEGYPVLSADGAEIVLGQDANGEDYKTNLITIDTDGNLLSG